MGQSVLVASDVMRNYSKYPDPTGNAIMYHANYVKPAWASDYKRVVAIDAHIFYTEKVAN
jgi:spore germination cell wall hydrolase CwlJ-like protein